MRPATGWPIRRKGLDMTTTFTIADFRADAVHSGLSASEAAHELLSHDGAEYDVRAAEDGAGFELWHRKPNAHRVAWVKTVIWSSATDREAAEADIFAKVIASGHWDRDDLFVGTDEAYAETLAEQDFE